MFHTDNSILYAASFLLSSFIFWIWYFQVSTETSRSQEELMAEAKDIVEEMGHAFSMKNIRMLGYLFPKVYRRLYEHIYVNREGVDKVKNIRMLGYLFPKVYRMLCEHIYICQWGRCRQGKEHPYAELSIP